MEKLVITVAPTGSVPTRRQTPHVPITPEEIVACGKRCEAAGASLIHVHARNPTDESPSTDYELFKETCDGLRSETDLIVQISTGGRAGMAYEQRCERLRLRPEMASLTTGSVNFPDSVYENSPELIRRLARDMLDLGIKPEVEVFDVSMIQNALDLVSAGLARAPLHFDFVLGLKGSLPATVENLEFFGEIRGNFMGDNLFKLNLDIFNFSWQDQGWVFHGLQTNFPTRQKLISH